MLMLLGYNTIIGYFGIFTLAVKLNTGRKMELSKGNKLAKRYHEYKPVTIKEVIETNEKFEEDLSETWPLPGATPMMKMPHKHALIKRDK